MTWVLENWFWRSVLMAVPLVILVSAVCRLVPCRPATRHALWLLALVSFVVLPFMAVLPGVDLAALMMPESREADRLVGNQEASVVHAPERMLQTPRERARRERKPIETPVRVDRSKTHRPDIGMTAPVDSVPEIVREDELVNRNGRMVREAGAREKRAAVIPPALPSSPIPRITFTPSVPPISLNTHLVPADNTPFLPLPVSADLSNAEQSAG